MLLFLVKPYDARNPNLIAIDNTVAKTIEWTKATTYLLLSGGRESKIPGVNAKNNNALKRNIYKWNILEIN